MRYKLPEAYGKTRLVLLPVDPYLIHAYWEVAPEQLKEATLRFYRSKPLDYFDVPVDLQSRKSYVRLWRPKESHRHVRDSFLWKLRYGCDRQ